MAIVRINFNTYEEGEDFRFRLFDEAERNFQVFISLLSSYWQSTIDGPSYAREIKAMAIELARIRLSLDDVRSDTSYSLTRPEFLYQTLTNLLFPDNTGAPDPKLGDLDFRTFLTEIVSIYFKGSVPPAISEAVALLTSGTVTVREAFLEARNPGSGFDISDEFTFLVDVVLPSPGATDVILADKNIRILLNIIRPAHTLYRLKFILEDTYTGNQNPAKEQFQSVLDSFSFDLANYGYEDFRKFVEGIDRVDPLGAKKSVPVVGEIHTGF